jgi:serine/threonine protein kinase
MDSKEGDLFPQPPALGSVGSEPGSHGARPAVDQRVGSFLLIEKLGAGGIGEVWKARDRRLNRIVALKFIQPDLPPLSVPIIMRVPG